MCDRFVQYSDSEVHASQYDLDVLCETHPRCSVAAIQPVLAVGKTKEGRRELVSLRWGLVPAWSKGPDNRDRMINAGAETVESKSAYRNDGPKLLRAVDAPKTCARRGRTSEMTGPR